MRPVLVTGARGNVGRHIVSGLREAGAPVRAAGVDVPFDFTDPATWQPAFAGVDTMFLLRPPALGRPRRDLLPAVAAARDSGVRHVVFLSLQGAERNRFFVPHATVEAWLRASGLAWTFVRPSFFTQNLSTTHAADIRDRGQIIVPAGNGRTAFVDTVDVAAVATAALLDPAAHAGRAWTVTGTQALTYGEVAAILTDVLGRPVRYTRPGLLRYLVHARRNLHMSLGMAAITAAIYTTARIGFASGLTDHFQRITGRDPHTVAETLRRERAAWLVPSQGVAQ